MLMSIFILTFIVGLVSSENDYDKFRECHELLDIHDEDANFQKLLPNAEEITARCPSIKKFIDCLIKYHSPSYDFQYNFGDYMIIKEFVDKMCDEESHLHKGYVKHLDCFESMVGEWDKCAEVAYDVFQKYNESSFAFRNDDLQDLDDEEKEGFLDYRSYRQYKCLSKAYISACIGMEILEECGPDALDTYSEMYHGTRVATDFCGTEQQNLFMKGFLDFLESDDKLVEIALIRTLFQDDEF